MLNLLVGQQERLKYPLSKEKARIGRSVIYGDFLSSPECHGATRAAVAKPGTAKAAVEPLFDENLCKIFQINENICSVVFMLVCACY
jgi:hypothetical protein